MGLVPAAISMGSYLVLLLNLSRSSTPDPGDGLNVSPKKSLKMIPRSPISPKLPSAVLNARRKGHIVPRGSRLTPEWLAKMKIGGGFLSDQEKQLFVNNRSNLRLRCKRLSLTCSQSRSAY